MPSVICECVRLDSAISAIGGIVREQPPSFLQFTKHLQLEVRHPQYVAATAGKQPLRQYDM